MNTDTTTTIIGAIGAGAQVGVTLLTTGTVDVKTVLLACTLAAIGYYTNKVTR